MHRFTDPKSKYWLSPTTDHGGDNDSSDNEVQFGQGVATNHPNYFRVSVSEPLLGYCNNTANMLVISQEENQCADVHILMPIC